MGEKHKCAQCRRELNVGVDATGVDAGVIGMRGFVPLDDVMYFCCEKCLREYYDISDLPSVPGRVP